MKREDPHNLMSTGYVSYMAPGKERESLKVRSTVQLSALCHGCSVSFRVCSTAHIIYKTVPTVHPYCTVQITVLHRVQ